MSHQPFETWLLSEEPLDTDQAEALQAHLSGCKVCQQLAGNWSEVHRFFRTVAPLQPAAGFTARWHARLTADRLQERIRRQRRQSWWAFVFTAGMALLLLVFLAVLVALVYESPEQLLFAGVFRIAEALSVANLVQELLFTLPYFFITVIPPFWWAVIAAMLALLCLLWMLSLRRLMLPRRVTP
jgi:hypothetical protein